MVWVRKKDQEIKQVVEKLNQKLAEKDHKDERIQELVIRLNEELSKRTKLDKIKDKLSKEIERQKELISALKDSVKGYK